MKTILLVSNDVLHYRQKVYNDFYERFQKDGYCFRVLANRFQQVGYTLNFPHDEIPFSVKAYLDKIRAIRPAAVILFLHLKNTVMIPIILYCRAHRIPVIYWNHGINIATPDAKLKNALFHWIHRRCDALITYTPEMRKFFPEECQKKLFVAYNTLSFAGIDPDALPSKEETKRKYGIREEKVILYISRMQPYKRPELVMNSFKDVDNVAVVMMGAGFTPELQALCDAHDNLYYLGEIYGPEGDAVYKIGDVFSTPGHIGLAVNEAMFWGLPIVVLKCHHAPEIYYIKDGVTGYFARDEEDYRQYVLDLLADDARREEMVRATRETFRKEVSIERMYQGFLDAVRYCERLPRFQRSSPRE